MNYLNAACRKLHKGTAYFSQVLERHHEERKELAKIKKERLWGKQNFLSNDPYQTDFPSHEIL